METVPSAKLGPENDSVSGDLTCSFAGTKKDDKFVCGSGINRYDFDTVSGASDDSSVNIRFALPVCDMKGSLLPIRITYLSHIFFS